MQLQRLRVSCLVTQRCSKKTSVNSLNKGVNLEIVLNTVLNQIKVTLVNPLNAIEILFTA